MPALDPTHVFNQDVLFLVGKINRFIVELVKSQSSGASGMIEHDQVRLESYIAALRHAHAWVQGQPMLDLPETHPREFVLPAKPDVPVFECDSIMHLVRMLEALPWPRTAGDWLSCDATGCIYRARGRSIALVSHAAALTEDCARADAVISRVPVRGRCQGPEVVIDRFETGVYWVDADGIVRGPTIDYPSE
jgi:hypothetical protein